MATGRTPDASEKKRDEDSMITAYDARGKSRTWLTKDLPGGKLPPGWSDEPPAGTHPNDPDNPKNSGVSAANADRAAELDRREQELAEREAKLAESRPGGGNKQK